MITDNAGEQGTSFANALRDCLACGISFVQGEKQTAFLTREAAQIIGRNPDQGLDTPLDTLPRELQEIAQEAMASGRLIADRQVRFRGSGPEADVMRVSAVPVKPEDSASSVVLIFNNLTQAEHLEERIGHLQRLASTGTLAAAMAHEIKNAMVAGKTFVDLLLEKNADAELAPVVRRELGRIDAIVSRMLKFASPADRAFRRISLHDVLDHSLRLVQRQCDSKGIALKRSLRAHPDSLNGDEYELQQAFVNLLLNAAEATAPAGAITVTTQNTADGALLATIQDTGHGITPENMERLFEPFFTTKPDGTGLGLSVTRRIVHEHGGSISVQSTPGRGAGFKILLPI